MKTLKMMAPICLAAVAVFFSTAGNAEMILLEDAKNLYPSPLGDYQDYVDRDIFRPHIPNPCPDGWRVVSFKGTDFTCRPIVPPIVCPEGTQYFENGCEVGCTSLI